MFDRLKKKKPNRDMKIEEELEDIQRRVRCERRSISVKPDIPKVSDTSREDNEIEEELLALKQNLS
jgi:hypothetical protein